MGSADTGKGKACKNVRRLALVAEDALESAEDLAIAEVRTLKVPVMSGKGWANYVRNTLGEDLQRPYWGVVTTISLMPDPKSQFKVVFELKELIDFEEKPELFDALQKKIKETTPQLLAPYPEMEAAPPPPPPRARGRATEKPVKPVGRAAQAMAAAAAKSAGSGKRVAKY
jgi:DNA-directed RNA polymerase alpha subunit